MTDFAVVCNLVVRKSLCGRCSVLCGSLTYMDALTGRSGKPCRPRDQLRETIMRLTLMKTCIGTALAFALACGAARADVVVSSKIDTEGGVLGNIILTVLNANNIKTTDRVQLGATPVVRKAITAGEIDIYPEYTGNAAFFFEKADDPAWKDAAKGYELAKKLDYDANKIVWLTPSPANNTWAIALRKEVVEKNSLKTLSDFGKYVSDGGEVILAASSEFVNSAAALPAFQTAYAFTLKPEQLITLSGGDTAATIAAAANQTNGANAAMVYGTRRRDCALGARGPRGRQERPAGLSADGDHPGSGAERESDDRDPLEARLRKARSRHSAGIEWPRAGRRRTGESGRRGFFEKERLPEVTDKKALPMPIGQRGYCVERIISWRSVSSEKQSAEPFLSTSSA
ncbi:glycine betaine/choline ABC-type transport system substrate-binding protein [Sinorhizobium fredii]